MLDAYQKPIETLLSEIDTNINGLSEKEAIKRLSVYGRNELLEAKQKSIFRIFLEQFKDFLVIILMAAALISFFLGDGESALVIAVVITMNAVLGTIQHKNAKKSLDALKQMSMPFAKVYRENKLLVLPSADVVPGDILFFEAGDYICADGRILESASIRVNESALTGESMNVEKQQTTIEKTVPLGDRINMVYQGSFLTYGRGKILVTNTGMNTEMGKIAASLNQAAERKTPLQENLDQFGKRLSLIIIIICGILFCMSIFHGTSFLSAFMFAIALAVAAIPEALSSIVTIVLAFGTQKMAKEHAIIRKLHAVEGLGSVSIICSDKTGTLTQNRMQAMNTFFDGKFVSVQNLSGASSAERMLLAASILCNDAKKCGDQETGDPTELAFIKMFDKISKNLPENFNTVDTIQTQYPRLAEIPFDSIRKLMSTVHQIDNKMQLFTKGAVDVLLSRSTNVFWKNKVVLITNEIKKEIQEANDAFSQQGLRVLAFGIRKIDSCKVDLKSENCFTFIGLIAMMDPPREESKISVQKCIRAGIRPIMITGDHKVTATAIAKEIGIMQESTIAVDGMEIDNLTDEELNIFVENVSVYARVSPEHKIRIVRAWQQKGHIVAMTGDGVNDAPALKKADIGVAMGIAGSEIAKDSADMVLADDNFATIVKAIENGRNLYANIKKSIKFLLSGNAAALIGVLYASFAGLAVPFAPVHLLFINLLTDSLPAIALGLDPHNKNVMLELPRPKTETILTKDFLIGIFVEGIIIGINTMIGFYIGLSQGVTYGMTMAFATLCLSRLVHGFNSKSEECILGKKEIANNRFLWGAFFMGVFLLHAVLLIPQLKSLFQVELLTASQFIIIYILAASNIFEIQFAKWLRTKIKAIRKI